MISNGAAPAPCDDRGEGRVADRLGGAISNLPSPSLHASQHIDLWRVFLAFDNAFPLLASLRGQTTPQLSALRKQDRHHRSWPRTTRGREGGLKLCLGIYKVMRWGRLAPR